MELVSETVRRRWPRPARNWRARHLAAARRAGAGAGAVPGAVGGGGAAHPDQPGRGARPGAGARAGAGAVGRPLATSARKRAEFYERQDDAQRGAPGRGPELPAAPVRLHRQADLPRPDRHQPGDGVHRLPAGHRGGGAAGHPGRLVEDRAGRDQPDRADLPAGVAAGLAADRHADRQRGLRDQRHADVPEVVPDLGHHGHAVFAVDDADQHRGRRDLGRQGPGQRRQGAAAAAGRRACARSSCRRPCPTSSPACACRWAWAGWC